MEYKDCSDENLEKQYLAGDHNALGTLMSRHEVELRCYIDYFSWLKDKTQIEDIMQEISVKVITSIKNGQFIPAGPGSFKNWLYEVARNQCYTATKQANEQMKTLPGRIIDAVIPAPEQFRDAESAEKEHLDRVNETFGKIAQLLTPEQLRLLQLVVVEGKTYIEISGLPEFKGCQPATLRQRICTIRKLINQEVQKWQRTNEK